MAACAYARRRYTCFATTSAPPVIRMCVRTEGGVARGKVYVPAVRCAQQARNACAYVGSQTVYVILSAVT